MIVPTLLDLARMPVTVQCIGAWSWASVTTRSPASMWPFTVSTVSGVATPSSSAAESGHRLHDRAGLEDVGDDGVAQQVGVGLRVVAGVVAGAGAHRHDLAGVHVEDDRRRPGGGAVGAGLPRAASR